MNEPQDLIKAVNDALDSLIAAAKDGKLNPKNLDAEHHAALLNAREKMRELVAQTREVAAKTEMTATRFESLLNKIISTEAPTLSSRKANEQ
jgi:hypothetical protein